MFFFFLGSTNDSSFNPHSTLQPHLMDAHLPLRKVKDLYDLYSEISVIDHPGFEEHPSQSLKYHHVRNIPPVFFFPGLSSKSMEQLMKKVFYPAFLARIPAGHSMDDIVTCLYKVTRNILSR